MERTTLATISLADLTAAFNLIYTDYVITMVSDDDSMRRHMASHDIAPEHSLHWRDDDGATIGLALLGVRGERGWVGGFGIAPAWRGRGLSHQLIVAIADEARQLGLRRLDLEVLVQNPRAIATYTRAGFALRRDLRYLTRATDLPLPPAPGSAVQAAAPALLLAHGPRLRAVPPVWQRDPASWADRDDLQGLVLGTPAAPDAYLIYRTSGAAGVILDFAAPGVAEATLLANALVHLLPDHTLHLTNEGAESPVCTALDQGGWHERLRQHEMILALA